MKSKTLCPFKNKFYLTSSLSGVLKYLSSFPPALASHHSYKLQTKHWWPALYMNFLKQSMRAVLDVSRCNLIGTHWEQQENKNIIIPLQDLLLQIVTDSREWRQCSNLIFSEEKLVLKFFDLGSTHSLVISYLPMYRLVVRYQIIT